MKTGSCIWRRTIRKKNNSFINHLPYLKRVFKHRENVRWRGRQSYYCFSQCPSEISEFYLPSSLLVLLSFVASFTVFLLIKYLVWYFFSCFHKLRSSIFSIFVNILISFLNNTNFEVSFFFFLFIVDLHYSLFSVCASLIFLKTHTHTNR